MGNVNFSNVHFKEPIYFSETKFGGYANFKGAEFTGGDAYFTGAEFGGYANFGGAKFTGGDAGFKNAKFTSGNANFARAKFAGGDVYFMEAKFTGGNANFMDVKFTGGDVNFSGTKFIGGYAYFMGVKFTGGDANFVGAKFYKELKLDDFKFDRLYIDWNSIKDKLVFNGPVYLPLIKNFRIIERFCDADDCYYAYRKASQAQKHWYSEENWLIEHIVLCCIWISANIKRISEYFSWINNYPPFTWIHRFNWSKLLDWIGFVSCGYGVRIQPIILWVLGSVLSFTLLYKFLPERYGGITESGPSTVTMEALSNSTLLFTFSSGDGAVSPSWGECLYFSFTALTGGTPDGLHPLGLCKYAVMVEGVLGYLFLALFVVVLARKIIR